MLKNFFRTKILPYITYAFYRLLTSTWRVKVIEPVSLQNAVKNKKADIFAIWHGDELIMISLAKRYKICTLTSTSKDGELMDFLLRKLGMKTARGSSSKKAISGFKKLIRLAREGNTTVFAVDGPRGPYKKIKAGVFDMAKRTQSDIYAAGVAAKPSFVFKKSWNKAHLPYFFAKVVIVWSEPLRAQDIDDPKSPEAVKRLEERFDAAGRMARQHLAGQKSGC